ncbi:HNH endonuclease [Carboxydocella sp. ULO1]|uniref:HNH endonuclease n=1 Tax=Carboxydocella sp. ULO1 TaxID=1926599 RepID=UPI0009AD553D|nr:HNH endonuclease [Carboxydocella sp. ULO1]GAW29381.1 hypothetical protein ULO1_19510 [Carboxydocella sp. ULO1]
MTKTMLKKIIEMKKVGAFDNDKLKKYLTNYTGKDCDCLICFNYDGPDNLYNFHDFDKSGCFIVCPKCVQKYRDIDIAELEKTLGNSTNSKGLSLRFRVLERDGFRCAYCGRSPSEHGITLHVDHVIPKSLGGSDLMNNLITACMECNEGKSNRIITIPEHIKFRLERA